MIDYLEAKTSAAFILSNDSKKKISLFEKTTPRDSERKRGAENKKRQKAVNEGWRV